MIKIKNIEVDSKKATGIGIKTNNEQILVIRANNGILGCGYINCEIADKFSDAVTIVSGVKTFDDMLTAKVVSCSQKARAQGVSIGISGKEALIKMS